MRFNAGGVVLVLIGLFLLAQNLGLFEWSWLWQLWQFWPVALILAGVAMLLPRKESR